MRKLLSFHMLMLIFLLASGSISKGANVDSLLKVTASDAEIEERLEAYFWLVEHYFYAENVDSCTYYGEILIEEADAADQPHYEGVGYHFLGLLYYFDDNMPKTLEYYQAALDNYIADNDSGNVSMIYRSLGDVHTTLKNYDKAKTQFQYALDWVKPSDSTALSYIYHDLAIAYKETKDYDVANEYYAKSLEIKELLGDDAGVALTYNNLGALTEAQGDMVTAEEYYQRAVDLYRKIENTHSLAHVLPNLGKIYIKTNRVRAGIAMCEEAYATFKSQEVDNVDMSTCLCLSEGYEKLGNYKLAFKFHKEYIAAKDSLYSYERTRDFLQQENSYEYEKIHFADSLENAKKVQLKQAEVDKSEAELSSKRRAQYLLYGGIAAIAVIALILLGRFRNSQKQRAIIEEQKEMVDKAFIELEVKNEEILDSITYAKRIQSAILPTDEVFYKNLPDSFVLYKPKDIVAGDFYWMEEAGEKILFAAADCTGHGVPGAMVSVFCNNGLNRTVREHGITDPGKILDKTRDIVVREFEKSDENVKDGMDIALCSLEGNQLHYAGAHNPLWIVRAGANEVEEIRADKQPIGKFISPTPYTTHTISLNKGDTFYIFSDGYQDQFGGEKGKKFKAKNLKTLLLKIQSHSMQEQMKVLDESFESWKGGLEQLDDVCMIGVRL